MQVESIEMKDKRKNIKNCVGIIMAVLLAAIIIVFIGTENKKNNDAGDNDNSTDGVSVTGSTVLTKEEAGLTYEDETESGTLLKENRVTEEDNKQSTYEETGPFENITTHSKTETVNNVTEEETTYKKSETVAEQTERNTGSFRETSKKEESSRISFQCEIAIYCKTILDNMDSLKAEKKQYVPSDGVILEKIRVTVYENETVYDIIKRVCREHNITLLSEGGTSFQPAYIRGINNICEFDCMPTSGWKYCVNGEYPSYSCDKYVLKDNDVIIWNYTCTMKDL